MLQFEINTTPDTLSPKEITAFLQQRPVVSTFQFPEWAPVLHAAEPYFFVTGKSNGDIHFFAVVTANGRKYYNIQFGPVATGPDVLAAGIRFITRHCRWKALCLTLQLPATTETPLKNLLAQTCGARSFDDRYNWSTPVVSLAHTEEALLQHVSKHHQRAIKKAQKAGLQVFTITDMQQIQELAKIYISMYHHRKLPVQEDETRKKMTGMQERFAASGFKEGSFFGVRHDDRLLGGIALTFTGDTAFYYLGASDPEQRALPLLHLAFIEAMYACRKKNLHWFDFGGYTLYAPEDSQETSINRFKMQFGAVVKDYVPRMYFDLVPAGTKILRFLRNVKTKKSVGS